MVVEGKRLSRCAITDLGAQGLCSPESRRLRLAEQVRRWAVEGVDIVQLREKQLDSGEMLELAKIAMGVLRGTALAFGGASGAKRTKLVINGRADVAAAAAADGVHLTARSGELTPGQAKAVFARANHPSCLVSVSCHSVAEVVSARDAGADLILLGPVFEKRIRGVIISTGLGVSELSTACSVAGSIPVLALGGVTEGNAPACLAAGAAGVAGIRLFA